MYQGMKSKFQFKKEMIAFKQRKIETNLKQYKSCKFDFKPDLCYILLKMRC